MHRALEPECREIIERLLNARNATEAADAIVTPAIEQSFLRPGFLQNPHLAGWGSLEVREESTVSRQSP